MPNFKTKKIKNLILPYSRDEVEFLWCAQNDKISLIYTKVKEESFFLQIKKEQNAFVLKCDKHTKPSKIAYLQKALTIFKEDFCEDIINEAFKLKNNALIEKTPFILNDFEELLFKLQGRIYIEIGFGSGRHLLYQARENPHVLILGVEIYNKALTQVAKLAKAQNINNILLVQSDARLLLSVLKSQSVEKIFLHFPVPWDKKPHRRVISQDFCKECARVLKYNGRFELRTDSFEYFNFTLNQFLNFPSPKFSLKKNENLEVSSKYEDRWKRQEKNIYDLWVWNFDQKDENYQLDVLDFSCFKLSQEDLKLIECNFQNKTIKKENFFLHFEKLYKQDENLILKIAFGAFNKPEHCYLYLKDTIHFLFKKPFKIQENIQAMKTLKEIIQMRFNNI
ncbi:tRNA (guanosine(46)-N7)-methyltransferase TrmB [Campylobacter hepaticus]|uniref:tRNA (guanine-N(7)-)-methyltransferase n=1 Tax=Campylobacter hepaticus TaxID=1813019 RepID=A0A6A7JQV1_9BACT|nr:tRNA (guanosine(46)-N7)-methyltransferase TrmB [Campylobacter hepaticus]AXP08258.1 tRNA (guanosine(46)-N7)-methyltransferase TrmB [Campylobacter hepaticus]MCZ0772080.1 tRNA (guanosine(46)-N7)-methyltransferase TrmB [Campylobacter hepaticus]MCZ0773549.1 tRNA (guanosine(46)-N7)-methyltransferase TrmB [Campylobacter hepaticus]MCZ0774799.1 tRNA (guanosine(46)-N7)-methyltransferase TrmB [Campylobacter hepaticus]MDX2322679.1 tRNA (guanosine(46)-N7)-methyltransferase TrmB [Campylobacter hepaticus]